MQRLTLRIGACLVSAAVTMTVSPSYAQLTEHERNDPAISQPFSTFLDHVRTEQSRARRDSLVNELLDSIRKSGRLLIQDSVVTFVYSGDATSVTVPSDLNGWKEGEDAMERVSGTSLFFLTMVVDPAARFEYKLIVDSIWMLDPLNPQTATGGYGSNSEIQMPSYRPEPRAIPRPEVPAGRLDTLLYKSDVLERTHPVYVYLPPVHTDIPSKFGSIWVMDGGEYLSLGLMNTIMDNLIHDRLITPVIGIFIDPRTDPRDASTSTRGHDYTMNDTFLTALIVELRERLASRYPISGDPRRTAVLGASLGGLASTYAATSHPEVFGLSAAQSPSYWWNDGAIFHFVKTAPHASIRFSIDTGTINDAEAESDQMRDLLLDLGYSVSYTKSPEGHNWTNWRARIDDILLDFFGVND